MPNKIEVLCQSIQDANSEILSVEISDKDAKSLAITFSAEYKQKYMDSAASIRDKLAFVNSLMIGVEEESEGLFGKTEYVVRAHNDALRVVVPSPSRAIFVSFLAKRNADVEKLVKNIAQVIQTL
jgi:hypothetical protein